jgi:excisionase family DNA binding protein
VAEMAAYLKLSPQVVREHAKSGVIPAHRLGSGPRAPWRFFLSEYHEKRRSETADPWARRR